MNDFLFAVVELNVERGGFRGDLPSGLWSLTKLEFLQLGFNKFSGGLSPDIGQLTNLRQLYLTSSGLDGEIPAAMGALEELEVVHMQFNSLEGAMPEAVCEIPTLLELQADCDKGGKVDCPCCTRCCSKKNRRCKDPKD